MGKFTCWMCPAVCASKRELKNHVARDDHGALRVLCVWCDEGRTFRRACDLKMHVQDEHQDEAIDGSLLTEANGFWFSLRPKDYARAVDYTPASNEPAVRARELVLQWLEDGNSDSLMHRTRKEWEAGWSLTSPEEVLSLDIPASELTLDDDLTSSNPLEAYDPETPRIQGPHFLLNAVKVGKEDITLDFKIAGGLFSWVQLDLSPNILKNKTIGGILARNLFQLVGRETPERPSNSSTPVDLAHLPRVLEGCNRQLGFEIPTSDVKRAFSWPLTIHPSKRRSQGEKPATISKKQCLTDLTSAHPSIMRQARDLLQTGAMPQFPPARREWTRRGSPLRLGGTSILWPPKGWTAMTADKKLLNWEFAAMKFEEELRGCIPTSSRQDLLDKYNFLGLPGTGDAKVELSELHKMRLYQYKFLVMVALAEKESDLPPTAARQVQMMTTLATMRDSELDPLLEQLDDVPLRLEA